MHSDTCLGASTIDALLYASNHIFFVSPFSIIPEMRGLESEKGIE